jgi:hypothetical protein
MNIIMEIVNTYGVEIIGAILTALAGVLGLAVKNLATKYINTKVKREIALTVVQGVEQLYKNLHGKEKLDKAMEAAAEMLAAQGITVTDLELRMLLEAAVGEFNDVFNSAILLDGIDVEDMTDEQLRDAAVQMGLSRTYVDGLNRDKLMAVLQD